MKQQTKEKGGYTAYTVAFCAIMAALGTVFMLSGGLIPILTYCSPLIASILLIPVIREFGEGKAMAVWAVTSGLSLILCPDREAAIFYCFIGSWPVLRLHMEKLPGRILPWMAKLCVSALLICAMYGIAIFVFGISEIVESFSAMKWLNVATLALLIFSVLMFDVALKRLDLIYWYRLRKRLKIDRYGKNAKKTKLPAWMRTK